MTRDAGFTLIEMLVALALTSMIAVAGSTLLVGTVRASDRLGQTTENVSGIIAAMERAVEKHRREFADAIFPTG